MVRLQPVPRHVEIGVMFEVIVDAKRRHDPTPGIKISPRTKIWIGDFNQVGAVLVSDFVHVAYGRHVETPQHCHSDLPMDVDGAQSSQAAEETQSNEKADETKPILARWIDK